MPKGIRNIRLVCALPTLHVIACFAVASPVFHSNWEFLVKLDFPVSVFVVSAIFTYDHPLILFGTIGTVWWGMLGYLFDRWLTRLISLLSRHRR